MKGKRGSTMVEAAMVLPLLLLSVLSTILLVLYFYASLDSQIHTQTKAIEKGLSSRAMFRIVQEETSTSVPLRGIVEKTMRREYRAKHYVINIGEAIRLGRKFTEE